MAAGGNIQPALGRTRESRQSSTQMVVLQIGGRDVLIDASDESRVLKMAWHIDLHRAGPRARTWINGRRVEMHRFLMEANEGDVVDHINGNHLDNRRGNLRFAGACGNARNHHKRAGATSIYKGVCYISRYRKKWRAAITYDGRSHEIGSFETEVEAALAYDGEARKRHGEFARLNFPRPGEQPALLESAHLLCAASKPEASAT